MTLRHQDGFKFNKMKNNFPHLYVVRKIKVRWDESQNGDYDKSAHNSGFLAAYATKDDAVNHAMSL